MTSKPLNTIPIPLMRELRDRYGLRQFVETGTFRGDTAVVALAFFDLVWTCELSADLHGTLLSRIPTAVPNKHLYAVQMHSPDMLRQIFTNPCLLPALVWLDAHWMGGPKLGPECPLLDELRAIGGTHGRHVILIDDARLFLSPPPPPHDPREWPTFDQIVALCRELGPTDGVDVVGDVIVIRPKLAELETENPTCKT